MKRLQVLNFVLLLLISSFFACSKTENNDIVGTWQICDNHKNVNTSFNGVEGYTRYKIIDKDAFYVTGVHLKDSTMVGDFFGSYELEGDTYTEYLKFSNPKYKVFKKKFPTVKYKYKIEGDYLITKGVNNKFNEIWKKVEL